MQKPVSNKYFFLGLVLISLLYLFLRLWDLPQKLDFRLDQAFFLIEAKSTIESWPPRLLGPPTSKIFEGRSFFVGSNYYYLLGLVGKLSHWDPLLITQTFIIFEFVFYLFFIFFLYKKFGSFLALITFLSVAISPYLVAHSRFFWNPHLLIPLSILALYFLEKFSTTLASGYLFLASLMWGLAFSCHYSPIFWLPVFIYFLYKSHKLSKFPSYLLLFSGIIFGDLPFFIFEVRHQFYNLQTFFFVYTNFKDGGGLTSHYFVFPLLIFVIYFSLKYFSRFYIFMLVVITIIQFHLYPGYPSFGSIPHWSYQDQLKTADLISQTCPPNFNIATTIQGDTRFYDLRFLLKKNNCHPDNVDAYPTSKTLFLVSPHHRSPSDETVWEVTSLKPFAVTSTTKINEFLNLHRLDRQ